MLNGRRVHPERTPDVAQRAFGPIRNHRRGQCRAVTSVLGIQVLDHFLASLVLKVDVDVGWFIPFFRDKALKEQRHPHRIYFGDP